MRAADNGAYGNGKIVVFLNYDRIQKAKGRTAVKEFREICDLVNHVSQIPRPVFYAGPEDDLLLPAPQAGGGFSPD